ncbi:MAG: hypothetical protein NTW20_16090 [Rhodobacterales bacterium]|nr:hypothetical protein [Rhodobacterales bacterium]
MAHLAQAPLTDIGAPSTRAPGILARLLCKIARHDAAMAGQSRRAALKPETLRDSGLSPEDLTGAPSHDPALPFFMQAHFGRNRP